MEMVKSIDEIIALEIENKSLKKENKELREKISFYKKRMTELNNCCILIKEILNAKNS